MSNSNAMDEDDDYEGEGFEGEDDDIGDQDIDDGSLGSPGSVSSNRDVNMDNGGESGEGENSNSRSSFSSLDLNEIETDKNSVGSHNQAVVQDGSVDNSDSKSKSRVENSNELDEMKDNGNFEDDLHNDGELMDDDDIKSDSNNSEDEDSQSSTVEESIIGQAKIGKIPNLNECTGKPASMWKLVNGTNNDDSSKEEEEDDESESDSISDVKNKSDIKYEKDNSKTDIKEISENDKSVTNGKDSANEDKNEISDSKDDEISDSKDDEISDSKDGEIPDSKDDEGSKSKEDEVSVSQKDQNLKADDKKVDADKVKVKKEEEFDKKEKDGKEEKENKESAVDDLKVKEKSSSPAPIETRRRSLRNAAKKVEHEVKTPPKNEKRKATDSPRAKKQIKTEPKEAPKPPPEPTTEPMSKEILEEAKFPAYLKDTITLGCYVPIRDKNTSNIKLKEGESLLETPSITMPLLLKKPDLINKNVEMKAKEETSKKNYYQIKPFFNSNVGEFLIGIGLSRVNEWYEKDMMKIKQRQLKKDSKNPDLENSLQDHTTGYLRSRQANEPFNFELKKCEMCDFKTESELVLQGHLLVPHMTQRREFRCNFCTFITRDHKVILFHMEALHNKKGKLELPGQFFYDCPYCPFETNLKTRATSHTNKCMKYFLSARNQLPPGDWENPTITAKPITLADIKSYEMCVAAASAVARTNSQKVAQQKAMVKAAQQQPQRIIRPAPSIRTSSSQSSLSLYQQIVTASLKDSGHFGNSFQKARFQTPVSKTLPGKPEITVAVPGGQIYQVVNNGQVVPIIGHGSNSQFLIPSQSNSNTPQPVALFPNLAASGSSGVKNTISIIPQPSPSIAKKLPNSTSLIPTATLSPAILNKMQQSNLPKLQGPYTTVQTASKSAYGNPMLANTTFVICEICDGYLKDLEQLRTHMLWIHKVKIHPKMLSSRPPLNCQKCQWRFFTDQGLERHLLGAHGLVTSNMQELANKNQDGGRCTVCGRVYVCKLVSHMNQVHKATLKPAHLSYKCTVCSATFNLYKLFENHVYMFHSGSVKRSSSSATADDVGNAKKKLSASSSVEMTVVPAKKIENSVKVTVTSSSSSQAKGALPPPMKLPVVDSLPSVTITPTNVVPEKSNPLSRLKKNSVDEESGEKTAINLIKKTPHFNDIVRCHDCGILVRNISVHMKLRHTKKCKVKLCHILKCEKCLGLFDGMVVLHTADFEENSDSEGVIDETLPVEDCLKVV